MRTTAIFTTLAFILVLSAGQDLSALIELMNTGGAYVNVHTMQYPGGEIRGQF